MAITCQQEFVNTWRSSKDQCKEWPATILSWPPALLFLTASDEIFFVYSLLSGLSPQYHNTNGFLDAFPCFQEALNSKVTHLSWCVYVCICCQLPFSLSWHLPLGSKMEPILLPSPGDTLRGSPYPIILTTSVHPSGPPAARICISFPEGFLSALCYSYENWQPPSIHPHTFLPLSIHDWWDLVYKYPAPSPLEWDN